MQVILVKWGTKYSATYVNGLRAAILRRTDADVRFICITDDGDGLDPAFDVRPFPEFGAPFDALTRGCLPKVAMFQHGVAEPGKPAIFIDLDTAVVGDITKLGDWIAQERVLHLLSRYLVPLWRVRRLAKVLMPNRPYIGNTSLVGFFPEDHYQIFDSFIEELGPAFRANGEKREGMDKRFYDDERWISWGARDELRVWPRDLAAKFTEEYMARSFEAAEKRDSNPEAQNRRETQVAVTFHGEVLKPEELVGFESGHPIQWKQHKTRWNYPVFSDYWREILGTNA